MIIDFKARRTTLVASPVDGRSGIPTLTTLAESLGHPDHKGRELRRLRFPQPQGLQDRLLGREGCMHGRASSQRRTVCAISDESVRTCGGPITPDELAAYLDSEDLQAERRGMLKNLFKSNR
ncbi:MAG: hypothetical protein V8T46_05575 [Sutterella seckii]